MDDNKVEKKSDRTPCRSPYCHCTSFYDRLWENNRKK